MSTILFFKISPRVDYLNFLIKIPSMHIFLSDAHIRSDESLRARNLIKFLNQYESKIENLFILGDLFEFWFEYNIVFPKGYFKTLATLYNLVQKGKKVHYILGNHEVLIGNFLRSFGFIVYEREAKITLEGKKFFIAHGHKLDTRLWTMVWGAILTSKLNHRLYQLIHPDFGVYLAQAIAYLSRKQRRSPKLIELLEEFALEKFKEFDIVILAHSHIPLMKVFEKNKVYINTGDWIENFSYIKIEKGRVSLNYYGNDTKTQILTLV
uniref:UDP-2,3-diacylglucosamine diphosphatase n=1 Tax=candidate division WOR-3 bacterium TaxID=2052148 RepID=A0A7C4TBC7_UNCW3